MARRHYARFFGLTLALLALAGFVESAYAIDLESWDQKITNASKRFNVLSAFNNEAVLDKETGLVWEQSPATTLHMWDSVGFQCTSRTVGGRKGWRLPSVHELASLVDPANAEPSLPTGHPFTNVQFPDSNYWSATARADDPLRAWDVDFGFGDVEVDTKTHTLHAWCVRGGMNADQY
ncbi:MAG: DUF1566 domain-containing protein [bacterium]